MLGNYFYYEIVRKTVIGFGSLFNNIEVRHKADNTDQLLSRIKVPIAYGPIQKFLARIDQQPNLTDGRAIALTLPRLAFDIIGYQYDPSRKASPITSFCATDSDDSNKIKKVFLPVPYNISFRLSFATKLQDDALQILEQILPYFQPSYTMTINLMSSIGQKRDIPVTLNNIDFQDQYEGDFSTRRFIQYDLTFTAKTYFYTELPTDESGGLIKKVQIDYRTTTHVPAPREVRYIAEPLATKDYNDDATTTVAEEFTVKKTALKVVNAANIAEQSYIQVDEEVMYVKSKSGNTLTVNRGVYDSPIQPHYENAVVNLVNNADAALIELGDDFGFSESTTLFNDGRSYSASQGSDV